MHTLRSPLAECARAEEIPALHVAVLGAHWSLSMKRIKKIACHKCGADVPLPVLKCKRCGFSWLHLSADLPKRCPSGACRSPYWNVERGVLPMGNRKKGKS